VENYVDEEGDLIEVSPFTMWRKAHLWKHKRSAWWPKRALVWCANTRFVSFFRYWSDWKFSVGPVRSFMFLFVILVAYWVGTVRTSKARSVEGESGKGKNKKRGVRGMRAKLSKIKNRKVRSLYDVGNYEQVDEELQGMGVPDETRKRLLKGFYNLWNQPGEPDIAQLEELAMMLDDDYFDELADQEIAMDRTERDYEERQKREKRGRYENESADDESSRMSRVAWALVRLPFFVSHLLYQFEVAAMTYYSWKAEDHALIQDRRILSSTSWRYRIFYFPFMCLALYINWFFAPTEEGLLLTLSNGAVNARSYHTLALVSTVAICFVVMAYCELRIAEGYASHSKVDNVAYERIRKSSRRFDANGIIVHAWESTVCYMYDRYGGYVDPESRDDIGTVLEDFCNLSILGTWTIGQDVIGTHLAWALLNIVTVKAMCRRWFGERNAFIAYILMALALIGRWYTRLGRGSRVANVTKLSPVDIERAKEELHSDNRRREQEQRERAISEHRAGLGMKDSTQVPPPASYSMLPPLPPPTLLEEVQFVPAEAKLSRPPLKRGETIIDEEAKVVAHYPRPSRLIDTEAKVSTAHSKRSPEKTRSSMAYTPHEKGVLSMWGDFFVTNKHVLVEETKAGESWMTKAKWFQIDDLDVIATPTRGIKPPLNVDGGILKGVGAISNIEDVVDSVTFYYPDKTDSVSAIKFVDTDIKVGQSTFTIREGQYSAETFKGASGSIGVDTLGRPLVLHIGRIRGDELNIGYAASTVQRFLDVARASLSASPMLSATMA